MVNFIVRVPNDGKHKCNSSKTIKGIKYCPTPCKVKGQDDKPINKQFTQVCIKSGKIDTFTSNCEVVIQTSENVIKLVLK